MQAAALRQYIQEQTGAMQALWERLVRLETPTADAEAVTRLAEQIAAECRSIGMDCRILPMPGAGPVLCAELPGGPLPPVAILGHMDTVHPVGAFKTPWRVEGGWVTGPGVYDCKGGIAAGLFAIRALAALGERRRPLRLLLTGDEEQAHAPSGGQAGLALQEALRGCCAAFNCESGAAGSVVTGRGGGAIVQFHIVGRAAHAGMAAREGRSAILEAAHKICQIEALTDHDAGTLFNCGKIAGGTGANVIPEVCDFSVGVRYRTNAAFAQAMAALETIRDTALAPDIRCETALAGRYPAMEPTAKTGALLDIYADACAALGQPRPEGIAVGGCSDSAFATAIGVPTLCDLGVVGEGNHTLHERAAVESLPERCAALALAISMLPERF